MKVSNEVAADLKKATKAQLENDLLAQSRVNQYRLFQEKNEENEFMRRLKIRMSKMKEAEDQHKRNKTNIKMKNQAKI